MNKIVRLYNQNRIIIWLFIITVGIIIAIIQILNSRYKSNNNINNSSSNNSTTAIVYNSANNQSVENTNKNIQTTITSNEQAIDKFISLCNKGQIDYAYSMISDDCKSVLFPTKEDFKKIYCDTYFSSEKIFDITSWNSHIYKVVFYDNPITTGNTNKSNSAIDYISVNTNGNSYKLNICGFLTKSSINIRKSSNYVNVDIYEKQVFKDYEIYTIRVKNLTKADIYIDNIINSNMYISDEKSNNYYLNGSDYIEDDFKISTDSEKMIKLKFNRIYSVNNSNTKSLTFGNMLIKNKKYTVESTTETNQIEIKEKTTTYPESTVMEISLK